MADLSLMTVAEFREFAAPLLAEVIQLREESAYTRVLLQKHNWISREEAESLLGISPAALLRNREKWSIRYRKGKRFVEYWLPDIWKYLKEEKRLIPAEIERRIQEAIAA